MGPSPTHSASRGSVAPFAKAANTLTIRHPYAGDALHLPPQLRDTLGRVNVIKFHWGGRGGVDEADVSDPAAERGEPST